MIFIEKQDLLLIIALTVVVLIFFLIIGYINAKRIVGPKKRNIFILRLEALIIDTFIYGFVFLLVFPILIILDLLSLRKFFIFWNIFYFLSFSLSYIKMNATFGGKVRKLKYLKNDKDLNLFEKLIRGLLHSFSIMSFIYPIIAVFIWEKDKAFSLILILISVLTISDIIFIFYDEYQRRFTEKLLGITVTSKEESLLEKFHGKLVGNYGD